MRIITAVFSIKEEYFRLTNCFVRTSLPSAPINAYLRVPTKYKFSFAKYQTGQVENERSVFSRNFH